MLFVGDMWPNKEEDEPEWVKGERTQFSSYRDSNGDGFMDHDEVKNWIIPPNYDHSEAEAKHLIYEADANKVCVIVFYFTAVLWLGTVIVILFQLGS